MCEVQLRHFADGVFEGCGASQSTFKSCHAKCPKTTEWKWSKSWSLWRTMLFHNCRYDLIFHLDCKSLIFNMHPNNWYDRSICKWCAWEELIASHWFFRPLVYLVKWNPIHCCHLTQLCKIIQCHIYIDHVDYNIFLCWPFSLCVCLVSWGLFWFSLSF